MSTVTGTANDANTSRAVDSAAHARRLLADGRQIRAARGTRAARPTPESDSLRHRPVGCSIAGRDRTAEEPRGSAIDHGEPASLEHALHSALLTMDPDGQKRPSGIEDAGYAKPERIQESVQV